MHSSNSSSMIRPSGTSMLSSRIRKTSNSTLANSGGMISITNRNLLSTKLKALAATAAYSAERLAAA
jgi:hypothetical protein